MELCMRVHGEEISGKEKEFKSGPMELNMKDHG